MSIDLTILSMLLLCIGPLCRERIVLSNWGAHSYSNNFGDSVDCAGTPPKPIAKRSLSFHVFNHTWTQNWYKIIDRQCVHIDLERSDMSRVMNEILTVELRQ